MGLFSELSGELKEFADLSVKKSFCADGRVNGESTLLET